MYVLFSLAAGLHNEYQHNLSYISALHCLHGTITIIKSRPIWKQRTLRIKSKHFGMHMYGDHGCSLSSTFFQSSIGSAHDIRTQPFHCSEATQKVQRRDLPKIQFLFWLDYCAKLCFCPNIKSIKGALLYPVPQLLKILLPSLF